MNLKVYKIVTGLIIIMIMASVAFASADQPVDASMPKDILIAKDTIIKVQAVNPISSQQNKQNEKVHFKVIEDIPVGDVVIVPANTNVEAIVTKVKKAGSWGRAGLIEVVFSEVKTKNGQSVPVNGILKLQGNKPNVLVKYSLGGVFIKGKEAVAMAGTQVNLQVKEDIKINCDGVSSNKSDSEVSIDSRLR